MGPTEGVGLEPRTVATLAASGEFSVEGTSEFRPVRFEDDAWEPDNDTAAVSLVHLSPDAPAGASFTTVPVRDATLKISLPGLPIPTDNGTATDTGVGTETATATEAAA